MKNLALFFFASLPLSVANSSTKIESPHCPIGCPEIQIDGNTMIFERLYALSQNPTTKFADWVAYEVDVQNFGTHTNRDWKNQPLLSEDETLEEKDYKNAYKQLKTDRGHQVPLASFTGNKYWYTLNYLSNITPQSSALNQNAWQELESKVREKAEFRDSLYVISGPIYSEDAMVLPAADEPHKIPSAYYKIIYKPNKNLSKGEAAVFIMPQDIDKNADFCNTLTDLKTLQPLLAYSLPQSLTDSTKMATRLDCN
ncbi:DNA/RNA non-specific endonuclease [Vibrio sp. DW001]|uniref:DNA/RNA non-specific endonuclease n=1 Tax=Vibrio sp. DW001 TaxID=2912315 RepID=UPI0023B0AE0B|nr:DNA/RNA non-specific endonuclease [Vibrio sp. DW001]WED27263.1 DNA/RNA non-specific endonuclease [Vibrio sp. DW001]